MIVALIDVHRENGERLISIITMHNHAFHPIALLLHLFVLNTIDKIICLIISRLEQTWLITSLVPGEHLLLVIVALLTLYKLAPDFRHSA